MPDPLAAVLTFTFMHAAAPASALSADSLDPGPSPECPSDMRLVKATHYDEVEHICLDVRDGHCFSYFDGITGLEGPTTDISVCMDQYEAPNKKGAKPLVMRSYNNGTKFCAERGKRMCSEHEWETACEGPAYQPLSYGWSVDVHVCNSAKAWKQVDFDKFAEGGSVAQAESDKLWQGTPSGRFPGCVSAFGVFDMNGNVEEWVTSRKGRKVPGSLMGGFWAKPWTGCRGTNDAHEPSFVFYETGFRCCAEPGTLDADGKKIQKPH